MIGVDEAGRGPLAGPVVAAAVQLSHDFDTRTLTDSKKLSAKKREQLFAQITATCRWAVAAVDALAIDKLNILNATLLAMKQAIIKLNIAGVQIAVDGNRCPDVANCRAIIKGDLLEPAISAASIVAKVWRDRQMIELDRRYRHYGFKQHKGYGTPAHMRALKQYGAISGIHRQSFAPVKHLQIKN